ncbi:isoleucine--tRNA ligase [Candidatus Woesearchaeota archaeon]|nr:isoleucine--tRNA ligase [Candidatus Woesearchaeota archaeon]
MIGNYDALEIEPEILKFWDKNKIYQKQKEKSKKGKPFYFLDGPPYTSGKLHLGHAWNYSMKDMVQRFKRMSGFNVWDRPGYDTHGLPTAHAVQAKLKLEHKDDIEKYGVAKFVTACKKLCQDNLEKMKINQIRLGIWMNFDDPYVTFKNEFIEGEWWLIKQAHINNRLYEGEKVMHWCPECATALAKHELEYQNVTDNSIFLKFKIKDKDNEYLVIWTTTPWTIPYNLGVMVNPEEDYVKAQVDNEVWIVASKLVGVFVQGVVDKKYKVIEELKGTDLLGLEYEHPLHDELKKIYDNLKKDHPNVHTVVLSKEYVDTTSGSGLVHMAPGCGPEDYEVGHVNNIPPFNNLNEDGSFPEKMGKFKGLVARKDDKKFIEFLDKKGALIATTKVEHEYAHCWRCKGPVVFRTTKQWFFKIEDLKEKMREINKKIKWIPDWAGNRQFDSWLDNLRDNSITRQRFWGCPVPIWKCDSCGDFIVIGSTDELKKLAGKIPEDLHKPWIDEVKIKCKCGKFKKRVPDILDVWVDAGTTSWTCLDYPQKKDLFNKLWPADFILEGKDQIRGWFNLLFVASMVSMHKPSYKSVYMHGFINDAQGRKMSKSLGNYILPDEVIEKYGADTLRYYSVGGANPGEDLNYNFDDMKIKHANLMILWNLHKFLIGMAKETGNPEKFDEEVMKDMFSVEEKYIFSKLNHAIEKTSFLFDEYRLNEIPLVIEDVFLELSRTYVQLVRDKSSLGSKEEKQVVAYTLYIVIMECLKLFAPIAPFITEAIYLNLKEAFKLKHESIHLWEWSKADKKMIDAKLEENMSIASNIIQGILYGREKIQKGLRWPLKEVIVTGGLVARVVEKLGDIIKVQTNVKNLKAMTSLPGLKERVKADYTKIGPEFHKKSAEVIAHISTQSPETILGHIAKEGKYEFKLKGEKIVITMNHLLIEREIPKPYIEAEIKGGHVYLNPETDDKLEAEGYAREVMRKIQSLRKKAHFEKSDRIKLHVKVDKDLKEMLKPWEKKIKEKVGADKIDISELKAARKHAFEYKEKIKDYSLDISFDKVR